MTARAGDIIMAHYDNLQGRLKGRRWKAHIHLPCLYREKVDKALEGRTHGKLIGHEAERCKEPADEDAFDRIGDKALFCRIWIIRFSNGRPLLFKDDLA